MPKFVSQGCAALLAILQVGAVAEASTAGAPSVIVKAMQPLVDNGTMAGGVFLLATKDRIIEEDALGYRDLDAKIPEQDNDLFWIASQSKAMTCAGLMILADEGKVSVDDPVEKYLPEFHAQKVIDPKAPGGLAPLARPVKLRDLMTHTSGLSFSVPMETPTLDASPLAERVKAYAQAPLNTQPGTKFKYANAGINTIGRVIEVVSGEKYEDFLAQRLFRPLGMTDTTFYPTAAQLARLADSYAPDPKTKKLTRMDIKQLKYPLDGPARYPMPAGGLFSTAGDVLKFCRMLMAGGVGPAGTRVLSAQAVKMMTTNQIPGVGNYGFGLTIDNDEFLHGGAYQTEMAINPARGLIRIIMVSEGHPWPAGPTNPKTVFKTAALERAQQAGH
jgi:CubicO group peptidase (beta-lactamase class C family)